MKGGIFTLCIPFFTGNDNKMEDEIDHELLSEAQIAWSQREWSIQHVLFPSLRLFLKPPPSMAENGTFVQVLCISNLLRSFMSL